MKPSPPDSLVMISTLPTAFHSHRSRGDFTVDHKESQQIVCCCCLTETSSLVFLILGNSQSLVFLINIFGLVTPSVVQYV